DVTLSCLDESDNIVLVAEPSLSSLRAVNAVVRLTQRLGYLKDSLKLIINRHHSNGDELMEEVIEAMEVDKVARVNNDFINFNESLKEGRLLKDFKPEAHVNSQLNLIAHMLHNGSLNVEVEPQQPIEQKTGVTKAMDWVKEQVARIPLPEKWAKALNEAV
ncbi:MAG: hypothetical protein R3219_09465, partial [Hydrogenovibrio sp.]|nr:hypothetical protein [Hydrogenovibrio sp.]